jgi:hypothetical protein
VSDSSADRHEQARISTAVTALHAQDQAGEGSTLVDWVMSDQERADALYLAAVENGQSAQALNVPKERRGQHDLLARPTSAHDARATIFEALTPRPDAGAAVSGRLTDLEAES